MDRTFWQYHTLGLIAYGVLLWLVFHWWPLDTWLISPFVGTPTQPFPLKEAWLLTTVAHEGLKHLIIGFVAVLLFCLILKTHSPTIRTYRSTICYVLVAMAASTAMVGLLKSVSHHSCPWHLTVYGGVGGVEYPLFGAIPINAGVGKCFPGGHAAAGFALLALYFAARMNGWRHAWCYALIGIGLGMLMGYAQMMRGAHFMSHNLWTLWWTWLVQLVVFAIWSGYKRNKTSNIF